VPVDFPPDAFDGVRGQPDGAVVDAALAQPLDFGFVHGQCRHVFQFRRIAECPDLQDVVGLLERGDIGETLDVLSTATSGSGRRQASRPHGRS
jgi:hypothetical protein